MLGLEADRRSLCVSVFGVKSIVTDSKTVTVHLESLDGGTKREVFLWTAPNLFPAFLPKYFHIIWDLDRDLVHSELTSPLSYKPPKKLQFLHGLSILAGYSVESQLKTPFSHSQTVNGR